MSSQTSADLYPIPKEEKPTTSTQVEEIVYPVEDMLVSESDVDTTKMNELLRQLRAKYTGDAINSECFPVNPIRSHNSRYIQFENAQAEQRIGRIDWCTCLKCVQMPTNVESICCKEIENAAPYIGNSDCITVHEFFNIFGTREETVQISFRSTGEYRKPPPKKDEPRLLRKTAYRGLTAWVHGYLGVGNRRPIPSCVVRKVCEAFPEVSGQYMGFIALNDIPAEFMPYE